jgi:hypothetical protein
MAERVLTEDQYFYVADGSVITSLTDLKSALKSMSSETFEHHVSGEKNDFYNWVKACLKDSEAASHIKQSSSAQEMISALEDEFASPGDFFSGNIQAFSKTPAPSEKIQATPSKKQSKKISVAKPKVSTPKSTIRSTSSNKTSSRVKSRAKTQMKPSLPSLKETPIASDELAFELDDQRDVLARIRERIKAMDDELRTTRTKYKASVEHLDEKYPELTHQSLGKEEQQELKKKNKLVHHVSHAAKKAVHHVHHHVKNAQYHIRTKIDDARQQRQVNKYLASGRKSMADLEKQKKIREAASAKREQERKEDLQKIQKTPKPSTEEKEMKIIDSTAVKSDMEEYYGQPVREAKPKQSFFHSIFSKFKNAEKVVEKELPNLHEFEHAKQAQEYIMPGANHYHHGMVDFLRGLLIGIILGMLFLILF